MGSTETTAKVARLRKAIDRVIDAARIESAAVSRAAADCHDDAMKDLRQAHLKELDALQALVASLELFDRRLSGTSPRPIGGAQ